MASTPSETRRARPRAPPGEPIEIRLSAGSHASKGPARQATSRSRVVTSAKIPLASPLFFMLRRLTRSWFVVTSMRTTSRARRRQTPTRKGGLHGEYPFAGARLLRDILEPAGATPSAASTSPRSFRRRRGSWRCTASPTRARSTRSSGFSVPASQAEDRPGQSLLGHGPHNNPMARGWFYLAAVVDWAGRRVFAHRVSITMVPRSAARRPDQKGCCGCLRTTSSSNALWCTIWYEHVYDSVSDARAQLAQFIEFYNTQRPHSALDKKPPDECYFASLPALQQAARTDRVPLIGHRFQFRRPGASFMVQLDRRDSVAPSERASVASMSLPRTP